MQPNQPYEGMPNPHATWMETNSTQDGQQRQAQGARYYGGMGSPGGDANSAAASAYMPTQGRLPTAAAMMSNNSNNNAAAAGMYGGGYGNNMGGRYGYNANAAAYVPPARGGYAPPQQQQQQQPMGMMPQQQPQYYDAAQTGQGGFQSPYAPQPYGMGVNNYNNNYNYNNYSNSSQSDGYMYARGNAYAAAYTPANTAMPPAPVSAAPAPAPAPASSPLPPAQTANAASDAARLSLGGRASAAQAPPAPRKKGGAVFSLGKKKQESAAEAAAAAAAAATTTTTTATAQPSSPLSGSAAPSAATTATATAKDEAAKARNESDKADEEAAADKAQDSPVDGSDKRGNNTNNSSSAATATKPASSAPETTRDAVRKELARQREQSKKQFVRDPRPHFNVVFCGHVDAGKSTISGHLLMEKGLVDQREMDKLRREAELHHREGWEYAYVMDVSEEERSKGITRETGAAYFETERRRVTVLDAPGHKAFVPSMIGGATQADICVLVISSRTGEFETGFEKGGQTREHAMLVRTCGVKQMICVVNKMDEMQWSKERYDGIVGKLKPFLRQNGYDEERKNLVFIPVAGLTGDNLIKHTSDDVCAWYSGPTMMDVIDNLVLPETRSADDALCIPLVGAYKDDGKSFIYGKIESGSIAVGEKLQLLPTRQEGVVEGIAIEATEFEKCYPGDNVHLRVRGIDESDVHAGYVATSIPTTLRAVEFFQARVVVLEVKNIISAGSRFMLHIHSAQEEASFGKLLAKLDKKTGAVIEKEPACARAGDVVVVRIELNSPLVVETHKEFDKMGRFMLRDEGKTIAIGLVTKLYLSTHDNIIKAPAASSS